MKNLIRNIFISLGLLEYKKKLVILFTLDIFFFISTFIFQIYILNNKLEFNISFFYYFINIIFFIILFFYLKIYKNINRYFGFSNLFNFIKALIYLIIINLILNYIFNFDLSNFFVLINLIIFFILVIGIRIIYALGVNYFDKINLTNSKNSEIYYIYGAGQAGIITMEILTKQNKIIRSFIDDDINKIGKYIKNIKINSLEQSGTNKNCINIIIVSIPSLPSFKTSELINKIESKKLFNEIRLYDSKQIIQKIGFKELFFKESKLNNKYEKLQYLEKKVVLVTGAAGSIGQEICCQLLDLKVSKILVIDNNENSLSWLKKKIDLLNFDSIVISYFLVDLCNYELLQNIVSNEKPNIIFHAAAYKHVDIVEQNKIESIRNNIIGLNNVLLSSQKINIDKFIFISTDKAVKPINILGKTKRCGEILINSYNNINKTNKYISVRFGNVIGSSGSLIPILKDQISRGGPITITDKNATRYFMTISDAVNLVLKSPNLNVMNAVYVLRMGKPINIYELAKKLVKENLSNQSNIKFKFIGLRPGEKLHEELIDSSKKIITKDENILAESQDKKYSLEEINRFENNLKNMLMKNLEKKLVSLLENFIS